MHQSSIALCSRLLFDSRDDNPLNLIFGRVLRAGGVDIPRVLSIEIGSYFLPNGQDVPFGTVVGFLWVLNVSF